MGSYPENVFFETSLKVSPILEKGICGDNLNQLNKNQLTWFNIDEAVIPDEVELESSVAILRAASNIALPRVTGLLTGLLPISTGTLRLFGVCEVDESWLWSEMDCFDDLTGDSSIVGDANRDDIRLVMT